MPDLYTIRGVLLELAGYDALPVTMRIVQDGDAVVLTGTPIELMAQLEEFGPDAQTVSFAFAV